MDTAFKPGGCAQAKLDYLATKRWLWGAAAHNCATFVEILAAGGSDRGLYSNCPALEKF